MSSNPPAQAPSAELLFRSADGDQLTLEEKGSSTAGNIINFALRSRKRLNAGLCSALSCATLLLWVVSGASIPFVVSASVLALQYKSFLTSTKRDTLLVVESIGVHIESKRILGAFTSTEFLPWDTVEDIFISEVIKGQRVLCFLTIIVRESVGRRDSRRLVPLFQDLLPERKCLEYINTAQFLYGKELLKIIRRIIKCHPSQGQQFGTQHLLVTYNCTSWTRQDKMFALLKFEQRNEAAAVSHAFVLTVQICPSSDEESLFDLEYPIVREADAAAGAAFGDAGDGAADVDGKATKTVIPAGSDRVSSRKLRAYPDKRISQILRYSEDALSEITEPPVSSALRSDPVARAVDFREPSTLPNGGEKSATETCTATGEPRLADEDDSGELRDGARASNSASRNGRDSEKRAKASPGAHGQEDQSTTAKRDEIWVELADDTDEETKETQRVRRHGVFSSELPRVKGADERLPLDESGPVEDSARKGRADSDETDESVVDLSEEPHLVAIDADDARHEFPAAASSSSSLLPDKSAVRRNFQRETCERRSDENPAPKAEGERIEEEFARRERGNGAIGKRRIAPVSTRAIDDRALSDDTYSRSWRARKQRCREFHERRATVDDSKLLRSSDITDLVMEGLMFTIRQDQDSVAVIEQKTKLEVDEVLENSEKAETEAGAKCLLNSSLLRLENLITMIDPPRRRDEPQRTIDSGGSSCGAIGDGAYSLSLNRSKAACYSHEADRTTTTNDSSVANYERHDTVDRSVAQANVRWQQQGAYSNIVSNDDYPTHGSAMEWEADGERDIEVINEEEKETVDLVEEDIVPEGLRPTTFSPEKANAGPPSTELLMDDVMNVEETGKSVRDRDASQPPPPPPPSLPPCCRPPSSSDKMPASRTLATSGKRPESAVNKRQSANVPRVISNKAITVEQMPPALQKILRQKRRLLPATSVGEASPAHDDPGQMQSSAMSAENAAPETRASSDRSSLRGFRRQRAHSVNTDNRRTEEREQSMDWQDDDVNLDERCAPQGGSSGKHCDAHGDTGTESVVEVSGDAEETGDKDESRVVIDLEDGAETRSNGAARHAEGKSDGTIDRTTAESRARHGPPRKLQDITVDFYHDLHAHDKNNATQRRRLRQRRRSLNSPEDVRNGKVRVEMLKFIQDMTRGVRVVVRRLNIDQI